MATIRRLAATDAVESYAERAQLFFEAYDIAARRQTAVFLSAIGMKTYQLLRDLMAPTLPKEKSLEDIVGVLKEHFQPKPLVIAERFYFHRSGEASRVSANPSRISWPYFNVGRLTANSEAI